MNGKIWLKSILLALAFMSSTSSIHAQYRYQPFVKEGKVWEMLPMYIGQSSSYYQMLGDTVIGGEVQKKVYLADRTGVHYICAVKEDGHRVYVTYAGSMASLLLYDFDAVPGSVIKYSNHHGAAIEYKRVALVNSTPRCVLGGIRWLSQTDGEYIPMTVRHVEGVGNPVGMDPFQCSKWQNTVVRACYEDGLCIYFWQNFDEFYGIDPSYAPLLREGRSWDLFDRASSTDVARLVVQGDTILQSAVDGNDSLLFRKIYRVEKQISGDTDLLYYGAIREDGRKVFLVAKGCKYDKRMLLFDFGLKTGEKTEIGGCGIKVDAVDDTYSEGRRYRRMTIRLIKNGKETGRTCHWTEGIGSDSGLLDPLPWDANGKLQLVVRDSETTIYKQPKETSTVETVHVPLADWKPETTYDLQGRRLTGAPRKGVYIRDGRKVVVK